MYLSIYCMKELGMISVHFPTIAYEKTGWNANDAKFQSNLDIQLKKYWGGKI